MEYETIVLSPLGPLTLRAGERGLTGLVMERQKHRERHLSAPAEPCPPGEELETLTKAREWLKDYFAGNRPAPDALPLDPPGTAFQEQVWRALLAIPYGEIRTYGELAKDTNRVKTIRN